ncbi:general transcription factor IIIA [Microdochium nivale]|nr:general transcription factor IIIA [Microdochium nivale]
MSFSNPRRTPAPCQEGHGEGLKIKTNNILRKGATFHSPTTPPSGPPSTFRVPSLPRRSQTTLEDVVDAHRRRALLTIGDIDKTLSGGKSTTPSRRSSRDDTLAVPRGFLDHTVMPDTMAGTIPTPDRRVLRPRNRRSNQHESDSGLGSSLDSATQKQKDAAVTAGAITRSGASFRNDSFGRLSSRAINRITEHTLQPLLDNEKLKDFRPIVLDCPRRIQERQIVCLRDLEKTLIFMAPVSELENESGIWGVTYRMLCLKERAKTADLYREFCLTSIQCIQATVEYLSDREQTRPNDRPYTNGYFIDLVEQIRMHAQQMQEARERQASGEAADELDVDPTDEVKLMGGLSQNGRPAELVRVKKNGKAISLATGQPIDDYNEESKDGPISFKRSMSQQLEDEEEIMRSMARRKKNATPEELAPKKCKEPGCSKEFKRPCDLTKHEKTHSRPWKCPFTTCKYHDYGWPTEKEMDRHVNDKHSSAPAMYECHFKPCPYKSKRESNCKQHMEKAHGWTYVRTKTNGKKDESVKGSSSVHPTPALNNLPTPSSDHTNPIMTPPDEMMLGSGLDFPIYPSNEQFQDLFGVPHLDGDIHLDFSPEDLTPEELSSPLEHGTPSTDAGQFNAFQELTPDFTGQFEDIYGAHVQLPTPPNNFFNKEFTANFSMGQDISLGTNQPQFSPSGQGSAMLYTPTSMVDFDEGFIDEFAVNGQIGEDFPLFPTGTLNKSMELDPTIFGTIPPSLAAGFTQQSSQDFMDYSVDWSGDFVNFPEQH